VTALALRGLTVELGGASVVDRVAAEVAHGEWVALIGPNGAGKSTLMRAAAGLVRYRGSVALGGEEVSRLRRRELARRLAFVPQSPLLPPSMRVDEYVLLGRTAHIPSFASESDRDHDAAGRALRRLDLEPLAGRPLGTLSGGEQQRAVLARALAQEAPVLLLDEPTSSLDVGRQQQALELVAALREQGELTVLSAMHDLTLAAQYADRLLLLSRGRLVAEGPPAEIATEALVSEHYGAEVRVIDAHGAVAVVPVRRRGGRDAHVERVENDRC
jgi:iron complex transport system ATP-binding protein